MQTCVLDTEWDVCLPALPLPPTQTLSGIQGNPTGTPSQPSPLQPDEPSHNPLCLAGSWSRGSGSLGLTLSWTCCKCHTSALWRALSFWGSIFISYGPLLVLAITFLFLT